MLDAIFDNASEADLGLLEQELSKILLNGEKIIKGFKLMRDFFVFTEHRLILVDVQGLTGKKKEYHSLPYKSITHFAVETAGGFDRDAEMKIWISGESYPIEREFKRSEGKIFEVQKILAHYVLMN
ncbi:PH domain-containing protein [Leptothoe sp. ISB3NOV94-8A]|uniref:PH domain-containing protein n=1 Tax=Adonisia turfae CCMR0081 TaxID=2292702 RepID=A0A6M0RQZ3_9CYAN|nr:PH domain-containing protein [Adonisia turfae]MDV3352021.1 PH domain-containing protein [Leptothoe sp. LEGE 181152]NEZ58131.1 PH domain-containing protein [Adonisia turfae CCMR0081]